MDFSSIFASYFALYRGDDEVPETTDPEYTVALKLANEAVKHWADYEGTLWRTLLTNHQAGSGGTKTVTTGTTTYACNTDMALPLSHIKVKNGTDTKKVYPLVENHTVSSLNEESSFAYFTGDPENGYTLNLNPAPDSTLNGLDIHFDYKKKPTYYTSAGTEISEMTNPYFVVHHMLANRFRTARNFSGYQTAKRDAENALRVMQAENNSGSWADPWSFTDPANSTWGQ